MRYKALILATCFWQCCLSPAEAENLRPNKALSVPASASSVYDARDAGKANDGILASQDEKNCWISANNQDIGAWWQADLGENTQIGEIQIQFRGFNGRYHFVPTTITVQVSDDGRAWTTVIDRSAEVPANNSPYAGKLHPYTIDSKGRYLRLVFQEGTDEVINDTKVVELVEVRVFEPAAPKPTERPRKSGTRAPERPNIIVVMADDMGFSDLGCYGGEIRTPTIDKLAAEGIRFSRFYNCNVCGPSRASLMTGCYPWQVGQAPGMSIFKNLTPNCATIPELMKDAGYLTCAVGRLDMVTGGNWHDPADVARGVDRVLGSASGGPGNYYKEAKGTPWFKDGKRWARPKGAYSTDLISGFVADFIDGTVESETPFFIYVSHYAPHWPLQAKEADIAPYREIYQEQGREALMQARLQRLIEAGLIPAGTTLHDSMVKAKMAGGGYLAVERMAIHAAMIESIDRSLAATMAALKRAGKLDNTLILVLSDNGASSQMAYDRGQVPAGLRPGSVDTFLNHGPAVAALANTPFRNYKTSDYEGGIASPLVAWWPAGLKNKGRITERLSHISDIMPTCLELAGVSYPSQFQERTLIPLTGKSFVSALRDAESDQNRHRVLAFPKAVRAGDWKLMIGKRPELYRIGEDRNEKTNLAAKFPERLAELMRYHKRDFLPRR